VHVVPARLPHDGAEPDAERAGGGVPVTDRVGDVAHAGTAVDGQQLDAGLTVGAHRAQQQDALVGVLDEVAGDLGGDDRQVGPARVGHAQFGGETFGRPTYGGRGARSVDVEPQPLVEKPFRDRCHRVSDHRPCLIDTIWSR
jgi:hypothetical protein